MRKLAPLTCLLLTPTLALAQQAPIPRWQIDAGPKQKFEVASIRQNKSKDKPTSNVTLTVGASSSLGLLIKKEQGSAVFFILDHVEHPTEN